MNLSKCQMPNSAIRFSQTKDLGVTIANKFKLARQCVGDRKRDRGALQQRVTIPLWEPKQIKPPHLNSQTGHGLLHFGLGRTYQRTNISESIRRIWPPRWWMAKVINLRRKNSRPWHSPLESEARASIHLSTAKRWSVFRQKDWGTFHFYTKEDHQRVQSETAAQTHKASNYSNVRH